MGMSDSGDMNNHCAAENPDDYDSPWKDVLEHAFPEFMTFYFPAAHAQIDWSCEHAFLNTELRQVVRDAELRKQVKVGSHITH
jgi:hypothetical protein